MEFDECQTMLDQAFSFAKKKNYIEALKICGVVINSSSNIIDPLRARAYIYRSSGNYQDAISDISEVIKFGYEEPADYFRRGRYYLDIGEWKSSIEDFTKVINLSESNNILYYTESAYFFRAEAFFREKKYEYSLLDCEKVSDGFSLYIRPQVRSVEDIKYDINRVLYSIIRD